MHKKSIKALDVVELTTQNFDAQVLHTNFEGDVVVYFCSESQDPYPSLSVFLSDFCDGSDRKFCRVNMDTQKDLVSRYNITIVSSILFFRRGSLVYSFS